MTYTTLQQNVKQQFKLNNPDGIRIKAVPMVKTENVSLQASRERERKDRISSGSVLKGEKQSQSNLLPKHINKVVRKPIAQTLQNSKHNSNVNTPTKMLHLGKSNKTLEHKDKFDKKAIQGNFENMEAVAQGTRNITTNLKTADHVNKNKESEVQSMYKKNLAQSRKESLSSNQKIKIKSNEGPQNDLKLNLTKLIKQSEYALLSEEGRADNLQKYNTNQNEIGRRANDGVQQSTSQVVLNVKPAALQYQTSRAAADNRLTDKQHMNPSHNSKGELVLKIPYKSTKVSKTANASAYASKNNSNHSSQVRKEP